MDQNVLPCDQIPRYRRDWLLDPAAYKAGVYCGDHPAEIILSNGLLQISFYY